MPPHRSSEECAGWLPILCTWEHGKPEAGVFSTVRKGQRDMKTSTGMAERASAWAGERFAPASGCLWQKSPHWASIGREPGSLRGNVPQSLPLYAAVFLQAHCPRAYITQLFPTTVTLLTATYSRWRSLTLLKVLVILREYHLAFQINSRIKNLH